MTQRVTTNFLSIHSIYIHNTQSSFRFLNENNIHKRFKNGIELQKKKKHEKCIVCASRDTRNVKS